MEKITGTVEIIHTDIEKTVMNYDRAELELPKAYNGSIPFNLGTPETPQIVNFNLNLFRETGKMNLNLNNIPDLSIMAEVTNRVDAIKTAITEEEVNIQAKIESLQAFYETQNS